MSKNDKRYPQPEKGEPWSMITEEILEEKGFNKVLGGEVYREGGFIHPMCLCFIVLHIKDKWVDEYLLQLVSKMNNIK